MVTAEDHQIADGMGSAVLEVLAQNCLVPVKMVGVNNRFGESGDSDVLMKDFGLTSSTVVSAKFTLLQ